MEQKGQAVPRSTFLAVLPIVLVASVFAGSAFAQEAPSAHDADLAGMRAALERIATLLERQAEVSSTELVFRRLDFIIREASPLESELNGLRTGITAHEARLAESETRLSAVREQLERGALPEGESVETVQVRRQALEADVAGSRRLLETLRKRRDDLELQLAANQAERDEWKRYLDQKLARLSQ